MPESLSAPVNVVVFQTLSARRATVKPGHLRGKTRLVYEDEAGWIEIKLCIEPVLTPLQEVWPLLLQCMCGLF